MAMIRQGSFADEVFEDYRRENQREADRESARRDEARRAQAQQPDPWFDEQRRRFARNKTPHHMRHLKLKTR